MRIVFMGSPALAIHPLQALLASEHEVVCVVSQPAKPQGRKRVLTDPPVASFAKEQSLLVMQPEKARAPEFLDQLRELQPDVVVTAAYGQILSQAFLDVPRRATVNIHPSALPAYRGAIPVPAALLDGREETAVTILFTVKALDAGHIILQKPYAIGLRETADALLDRLFKESGPLLLDALDRLSDETFAGTPQDENAVTHCRKIEKEDGRVDWKLSGTEIFNRWRAFQPWPGMFSYLDGRRITIETIREVLPASQPAGTFVYEKPQRALLVGCGDQTLAVERLKPEGGKSVDAVSFWNGIGKSSSQTFSVDGGS